MLLSRVRGLLVGSLRREPAPRERDGRTATNHQLWVGVVVERSEPLRQVPSQEPRVIPLNDNRKGEVAKLQAVLRSRMVCVCLRACVYSRDIHPAIAAIWMTDVVTKLILPR